MSFGFGVGRKIMDVSEDSDEETISPSPARSQEKRLIVSETLCVFRCEAGSKERIRERGHLNAFLKAGFFDEEATMILW
jgi:hypothetical protein